MKKIIKGILIGLGILAAILTITLLITLTCFRFESKKMTPMETKEVLNGIYSVNNGIVNFYLIKDGAKYISIDAGTNIRSIKKELKKLNISPEDITTIFLTHTDTDHIAGIKLFKNAKVYISNKEEQMVNGKTPRFFMGRKWKEKYQLLNDKQVLTLNKVKVKSILTPGHTPGSMSYLINDKYIFTGDLLSLKDGKVEIFNESFNMDSEIEKKSIKKLAKLSGIEYVFTGHYGLSNNYKKAFEEWK